MARNASEGQGESALGCEFREISDDEAKRLAPNCCRTQGELSVDDLTSEAWLIAIEIGTKRCWSIGFDNEDDQDMLFAWMHNRFVKYAEKAIRFAVKLDRDWDDESGELMGAALARVLTAPMDSDPQMRQQLHDEQQELVEIVRHSYSEAAAYILLLIRVDWHLDDLASLLWIGVVALRRRLKASGLRARVQPSLFDGREVIDPEFTPWRRGGSSRRSGQAGEASQLVFPV